MLFELELGLAEVEPDAEPEAEPDGAVLGVLGVERELVEPVDEELVPLGEAELPREAALSLRSQAASSAVPSATETASARVLNVMVPPWLGYLWEGARIAPTSRRP